jgi:hypothetical protein
VLNTKNKKHAKTNLCLEPIQSLLTAFTGPNIKIDPENKKITKIVTWPKIPTALE